MPNKGYVQTTEHTEKMKLSRKGKAIGNKNAKGITPWNKGKQLPNDVKKKISESLIGRKSNKGSFTNGFIPWNKGSKGVCKQNSGSFKCGEKARLGTQNSIEARKKIGDGNRGKKLSEETKRKISDHNKLTGKRPPIMKGEDNYNWKGGISFEPYTVDWTETLKRSVRERDNYICQICSKQQEESTHHVHHIDYDKKNCDPKNLITLCISCHVKTNGNRSRWIEYFKNKLSIICH